MTGKRRESEDPPKIAGVVQTVGLMIKNGGRWQFSLSLSEGAGSTDGVATIEGTS